MDFQPDLVLLEVENLIPHQKGIEFSRFKM
jgi:hypothetical protein